MSRGISHAARSNALTLSVVAMPIISSIAPNSFELDYEYSNYSGVLVHGSGFLSETEGIMVCKFSDTASGYQVVLNSRYVEVNVAECPLPDSRSFLSSRVLLEVRYANIDKSAKLLIQFVGSGLSRMFYVEVHQWFSLIVYPALFFSPFSCSQAVKNEGVVELTIPLAKRAEGGSQRDIQPTRGGFATVCVLKHIRV